MNFWGSTYLLNAIMEKKGQAVITVKGVSMRPLLKENDCITIKKCSCYAVGDIVVYSYKREGILVHRLLKIDSCFYCKGDNAFRIEDIEERDILGKVILVNGQCLYDWPEWKILLSYKVGRLFKANGYNREVTMQSNIYKAYSDLVLHSTMNQKYLTSSIITQNSFSGEIETDVINILTQPHSVAEIVEKLNPMYNWSDVNFRLEIEKIVCCSILDGKIVSL